MEQTDCVIVGAGIGGGVLALSLGRRGYRVIVVEREAVAPTLGRPEVLARSTVQAFQRLGIGPRLFDEAVLPLQGLELRQAGGQRLLTMTRQDIEQAGVQPYSTDPTQTRRILLEHAQAIGSVQVERGVEVLDLLREESRVVGIRARRQGQPLELKARLVVGDDGGHSRVRAGLGIPLAFHEFSFDFLVPRTPPAAPMPPIGRAWLNPAAIATGFAVGLIMPFPTGRGAMALALRPRAYERLHTSGTMAFRQAAAQLGPECAELTSRAGFPEGFVRIQRPFGHAARYVDDGAALLGDAAHPVTPVGGQGANMAVADALVLAEVAHEALLHNDSSAARLQAYEAVRRPANERSLQFSHRGKQVLNALITVPWLARLVPWYVKRNDRPEVKRHLLRAIASAFVSPSPTPEPAQHAAVS